MINISVKKIKIEVDNLKKLIDDYEEVMGNLFYNLSSFSFFWEDKKEQEFLSHIDLAKTETTLFLEDLKSQKEIFSYIVEKYKSFGDRILCDLSKKNVVMNQYNEVLNDLNNVINHYQNIQAPIDIQEKIQIQRMKWNQIYKELEERREEAKAFFKEMEEIEQVVRTKINHFDISNISTFDGDKI